MTPGTPRLPPPRGRPRATVGPYPRVACQVVPFQSCVEVFEIGVRFDARQRGQQTVQRCHPASTSAPTQQSGPRPAVKAEAGAIWTPASGRRRTQALCYGVQRVAWAPSSPIELPTMMLPGLLMPLALLGLPPRVPRSTMTPLSQRLYVPPARASRCRLMAPLGPHRCTLPVLRPRQWTAT